MADNENQDFEETLAVEDGVISAGIKPLKITHGELEAYIRAGIIKPMGNGVFAVYAGQGSHIPRYFQADYAGDGYSLTALANNEGDRVASATLDNGLGVTYRNGLLNVQATKQAPMFGGTGLLSADVNSAGQKSIGVSWNKKF